MRIFPRSSTKGFTLIEVLLIIFVIALLSMAAVSSFFGSNRKIEFLSQYSQILSLIREPRTYAINNFIVDEELPERFGVRIYETGSTMGIVVFADTGATPYVYDPDGVGFGADRVLPSASSFFMLNDAYVLSAQGVGGGLLEFPLTLFYETGTAELSAFYGNEEDTLLDKSQSKYLAFTLSSLNTNLSRHILIFQVAGIAEMAKDLPVAVAAGG